MRDVVKTNVKRQQSSKRKHRRTRYQAGYVLLVLLLVIGVGISLSMTLFFNVTTVDIINETSYDDHEIVNLSGIRGGENLVRLDTARAEKKIADALVYAEEVSVRKKFPNHLEITVTKSVPIANITYSFGYLLVSSQGKILESVEQPQEGLLIIEGFDPATDEPGEILQSKDPSKDGVLDTLTAAVSANPNANIHSLNMNDIYSIEVQFGEQIHFAMGSSAEASYKIRLAAKTIESLKTGKSYHMTMVGNNQISVISDDSAKMSRHNRTEQATDGTTNN